MVGGNIVDVLYILCSRQEDLFRLLKAYTVHNPADGYCQAQAPIAAVLLMHMPAEEAFWCFVSICEKYLPGYYSPGLVNITNFVLKMNFKPCSFKSLITVQHSLHLLRQVISWIKEINDHFEGWEQKKSKCFFTDIHLDLFRSHPVNMQWDKIYFGIIYIHDKITTWSER